MNNDKQKRGITGAVELAGGFGNPPPANVDIVIKFVSDFATSSGEVLHRAGDTVSVERNPTTGKVFETIGHGCVFEVPGHLFGVVGADTLCPRDNRCVNDLPGYTAPPQQAGNKTRIEALYDGVPPFTADQINASAGYPFGSQVEADNIASTKLACEFAELAATARVLTDAVLRDIEAQLTACVQSARVARNFIRADALQSAIKIVRKHNRGGVA